MDTNYLNYMYMLLYNIFKLCQIPEGQDDWVPPIRSGTNRSRDKWVPDVSVPHLIRYIII